MFVLFLSYCLHCKLGACLPYTLAMHHFEVHHSEAPTAPNNSAVLLLHQPSQSCEHDISSSSISFLRVFLATLQFLPCRSACCSICLCGCQKHGFATSHVYVCGYIISVRPTSVLRSGPRGRAGCQVGGGRVSPPNIAG